MGNFFYKQRKDPFEKIVNSNRTDILNLQNTRLYNDAELTEEFALKCKKELEKDIKYQLSHNMQFHMQFACMLPPNHRTYDSNTGEDLTNRFNSNNNMYISYIRNPLNHDEYLPILPVFEIIMEILKEMNLSYTVSFDRLKYNFSKWEEENAPIKLPDDYKAFL